MSGSEQENLVQSERKRGRPVTFLRDDREYLADLIREHGIRGARRAATIPVSQNTMLKIAREFGIRLPKGKRPRKAA
jgi:hypothetical protein